MRIRASAEELTLTDNRATLRADFDLSGLAEPIIGVDVYMYGQYVHPELHLGWWQVKSSAPREQLEIVVDLSTLDAQSISITNGNGNLTPHGYWANPDYVMAPVQDLQLVLRDGETNVVEIVHVPLRTTDRAILEAYANRVHKVHGYQPRADSATFVLTFHHYKLQQLADLFDQHLLAGGRVLDVGCGRSLFTELIEHGYRDVVPYDVTCCDVAFDLMVERQGLFPRNRWVTSDVTRLPFASEQFDGLFAGEIIEHIVDAPATLAEWNRMLRPGGTLVLTTPNRKRLPNLVNNSNQPLGPDHVNELTYDECIALMRAAGFDVVATRGIYLQLALDWRQKGSKQDLLHGPWNREKYARLLHVLLRAGRFAPRYAFNILYVGRKRHA
ncbi:MAG: class I SAM-dependent methyltransferase [Chloroflexi bacterium]|nr:class I SAM-dependent methyltransferase [Chloroflexota bacterium]